MPKAKLHQYGNFLTPFIGKTLITSTLLLLRLTAAEKTQKTELTKIKMKYDSKLKAMTEEVSTLTQHMTKYRRERDTYKEMLDGTQRTIAELKGSGNFKASRADNANEVRNMHRRVALKRVATILKNLTVIGANAEVIRRNLSTRGKNGEYAGKKLAVTNKGERNSRRGEIDSLRRERSGNKEGCSINRGVAYVPALGTSLAVIGYTSEFIRTTIASTRKVTSSRKNVTSVKTNL